MRKTAQTLRLAGAYIAFMVGSGVATGQELLQYYTPYGWWMFAVAAVVAAVLIAANYCYAYAGRTLASEGGKDVFRFYGGPVAGRAFRWFTALFCFLSYVVMVAAASAALEQQFNAPRALGGVLLFALTVLSVLSGLDSIVKVIGKIGPVLLAVVLVLAIYGLASGAHNLPENLEALQTGAIPIKKAADNWLLAGLSNGGFCLLWLAEFTASLGAQHSVKTVLRANILATVTLVLFNALMGLALLAHLGQVAGLQIPNLYLAQKLWPPLAYGFGVLIFAAVFNSSTPLLWTVTTQLAEEGSSKHRVLVPFVALVALVIALRFPFDRLMNVIYVINGYVGFVLLLVMLVQRFRKRKRETVRHTR